MLKLADIYITFTYVVVAVVRRLGYISHYWLMDDMVDILTRLTPHRAGKRIVQGLLIHLVWTDPDTPSVVVAVSRDMVGLIVSNLVRTIPCLGS